MKVRPRALALPLRPSALRLCLFLALVFSSPNSCGSSPCCSYPSQDLDSEEQDAIKEFVNEKRIEMENRERLVAEYEVRDGS